MMALIMAAGVGNRLSGEFGDIPKALLPFGGRTLLERHLTELQQIAVHDVVVAVGYKADLIAAELERLDASARVILAHNPDYRAGSVVTLQAATQALTCGDDILLMDADVLYDRRMLESLKQTRHHNCFLLDRNFEAGDEPMKLAVRDGQLVEFSRRVEVSFDFVGESVGFFRLAPPMATALSAANAALVEAGQRDEGYEEALRRLLLRSPAGTFGFEDITDLPWTEIDFPEDVVRAREEILPRLIGDGR
jgi:choline kinase